MERIKALVLTRHTWSVAFSWLLTWLVILALLLPFLTAVPVLAITKIDCADLFSVGNTNPTPADTWTELITETTGTYSSTTTGNAGYASNSSGTTYIDNKRTQVRFAVPSDSGYLQQAYLQIYLASVFYQMSGNDFYLRFYMGGDTLFSAYADYDRSNWEFYTTAGSYIGTTPYDPSVSTWYTIPIPTTFWEQIEADKGSYVYFEIVSYHDATSSTPSWEASKYEAVTFSKTNIDLYLEFGGGSPAYTPTGTPPDAPDDLTAYWSYEDWSFLEQWVVRLEWDDNSDDEDYFQFAFATNDSFTENYSELGWAGEDVETTIDVLCSAGISPVTYPDWYWRIRAVNAYGSSDWSSTYHMDAGNSEGYEIPVLTSCVLTYNSSPEFYYISVNWTNERPEPDTTYLIQRATNAGFTENLHIYTEAYYPNQLTYDKTGFADLYYIHTYGATTFYYRMCVADEYGVLPLSSWSNTETCTLDEDDIDDIEDAAIFTPPDTGGGGGGGEIIIDWLGDFAEYGWLIVFAVAIITFIILREYNLTLATGGALFVVVGGAFLDLIPLWIVLLIAVFAGFAFWQKTKTA